MQRIVMDVDTGLDDMVALLLAFGNQDALKIEGLVATFGNKPIEHTLPNTLNVAAYFHEDIPVYEGSHGPLKRPLLVGGDIHGADGMASFPFPPRETRCAGDGVAFLKRIVMENPGDITVIATGPMTDIARAITEQKGWKESVRQIVAMGGSLSGGNVTPYAEFNIFADPDAADIVFKSGIKTVLMPLDVTTKVVLTRKELDACKAIPGKAAALFGHCMEVYVKACGRTEREYAAMHDPCCVAYLLDPSLFQGSVESLSVVTDSSSERWGETVDAGKQGTVMVMRQADEAHFWALTEKAIRTLA